MDKFKKATFSIDEETEEKFFDGIYKVGDHWSGHYSPYFDLETAKKVLSIQNPKDVCKEYDMHFYELTEDGEHVISFSCDGTFVYDSVIFEGERYFPIGYGCWTWRIETEY